MTVAAFLLAVATPTAAATPTAEAAGCRHHRLCPSAEYCTQLGGCQRCSLCSANNDSTTGGCPPRCSPTVSMASHPMSGGDHPRRYHTLLKTGRLDSTPVTVVALITATSVPGPAALTALAHTKRRRQAGPPPPSISPATTTIPAATPSLMQFHFEERCDAEILVHAKAGTETHLEYTLGIPPAGFDVQARCGGTIIMEVALLDDADRTTLQTAIADGSVRISLREADRAAKHIAASTTASPIAPAAGAGDLDDSEVHLAAARTKSLGQTRDPSYTGLWIGLGLIGLGLITTLVVVARSLRRLNHSSTARLTPLSPPFVMAPAPRGRFVKAVMMPDAKALHEEALQDAADAARIMQADRSGSLTQIHSPITKETRGTKRTLFGSDGLIWDSKWDLGLGRSLLDSLGPLTLGAAAADDDNGANDDNNDNGANDDILAPEGDIGSGSGGGSSPSNSAPNSPRQVDDYMGTGAGSPRSSLPLVRSPLSRLSRRDAEAQANSPPSTPPWQTRGEATLDGTATSSV